MPTPTLIVEDGTVVANANSYISLADAQAYFDARLYSTTWTGKSADDKTVALINATKLIDANMDWLGYRVLISQKLDWPRIYVPDNRFTLAFWLRDPLAPIGPSGPVWPQNQVPQQVKEATAELAGEILKKDRTLEWPALGVSSVGLGQGALNVSLTPDAQRLQVVFTPQVNALLKWFGTPSQNRVNARVSRG